MREPTIPEIPDYISEEVVFVDRHRGIVMIGKWDGSEKFWLFQTVNGVWVSQREVQPEEIHFTLVEDIRRSDTPR